MLLDSPTHSICQIGLQDSALALSEEVFDASFCSLISRTSKSSYRLVRVQNRKKKRLGHHYLCLVLAMCSA